MRIRDSISVLAYLAWSLCFRIMFTECCLKKKRLNKWLRLNLCSAELVWCSPAEAFLSHLPSCPGFSALLLSDLLCLPRVRETAAAKGITTTAPLSSSTPKEREITACMCVCVSQWVRPRACNHTSSISCWNKSGHYGIILYHSLIHAEWSSHDFP